MSKKELIAGTLVTFVLVFWMIDTGMELFEKSYVEPLLSNQRINNIIGWVITIWMIGFLLLAFWVIKRQKEPVIAKLNQRFTVRAIVPGIFIVAFLPIMTGLGFALLTGKTNWGGWLMCLSIPTLLILAWITMRHSNPRS